MCVAAFVLGSCGRGYEVIVDTVRDAINARVVCMQNALPITLRHSTTGKSSVLSPVIEVDNMPPITPKPGPLTLSCRQEPQVPPPNATDSLAHCSGALATAFEAPDPSWRQLAQASAGLSTGRVLAQRLWIGISSSLQPGVRFYLTVLLTLAAANSLFILVNTSGAAHHAPSFQSQSFLLQLHH